MELLPPELRAQLPPIYAQEGSADPIAYVKFFAPRSDWAWYATEFDGEDLFFGMVQGMEEELGYFRLSELQGDSGIMGFCIERDSTFQPTPLSKVRRVDG